jgi:homoserine kinase type II
MAVYTEVSTREARALLRQLKLGELTALQGCARGIENTNYFVSTERDGEAFDYVLTLFERLTFEQLPFYLRLMKHLAERGIPVPEPSANARGDVVFEVKGKPAAVVTRLRGSSELCPTPSHCATSPCRNPICAVWPGGMKPCRWCCPTSIRHKPH